MGKQRRCAPGQEQDVSSLLSRLHLTQNISIKHKPGKMGPRQTQRKSELLDSMLLDISPGDQMSATSDVDYPALLQISDLLRSTSLLKADDMGNESRVRIKSYITLLKTCGLTAELHYTFLKQWQSITSRVISSPVFDDHSFWRDHVLAQSVKNPTLHCALLAVSGLHYIKLNKQWSDDRINVQTSYRLRAEAERRLRFNNNEVDHFTTVATHCCLLIFDYLTGNLEAYETRLVHTKLAMRAAKFSSGHSSGRYFFWLIARHDRLAYLQRSEKSVLDVDDLLWDAVVDGELSEDTSSWGIIDKIGSLYAELIVISSHVAKLTSLSSELDFEYVDHCFARWKDRFPLDLQTYAYEGDMRDSSCFLHALTCSGGPRAIALHCLFSETMILRLQYTSIDFQKSKIHENAMTICKLAQSLTSSSQMLHDSLSAELSLVVGSLYIAAQHLFSKDGKAWIERMLRWITEVSGNMCADYMADQLSEFWREERTRPKPIILPETLSPSTRDLEQSLSDFDMAGT